MSGTIPPRTETWVDCDEERAKLRAENDWLKASLHLAIDTLMQLQSEIEQLKAEELKHGS